MKDTINKLEKFLNFGSEYISKSSESEMTQKASPEKWSTKEKLVQSIRQFAR